MKFQSKFSHFQSRKCVWKCRLRNGIHFVSAQCVNIISIITKCYTQPPEQYIHMDFYSASGNNQRWTSHHCMNIWIDIYIYGAGQGRPGHGSTLHMYMLINCITSFWYLIAGCDRHGAEWKNPSFGDLVSILFFLAATKQLIEHFCLSVSLSVPKSVTPFSLYSHHRIIMKLSYYQWQKWCPYKRSRSEAKGQGHRGQDPT